MIPVHINGQSREIEPAFADGAEADGKIRVTPLFRNLDEHLAQADDLV